MLMHPVEKARDVLRFYHDFANDATDELMTGVGLMTSPDGHPVVGILACYNGPAAAGEKVLRPLREFGPPAADHISPMAYTQVQHMLDGAFPSGRRNYIKTNFMSGMDDDAIATLIDRFASVPSPYSVLASFQLGGAVGRVGKDDTAFYHRDAGYHFFVGSIWENAAGDEKNIRWARETWGAMRPFSADGVYVNEMGDGDIVGMCDNEGHGETFIYLRKSGDVMSVCRKDVSYPQALRSTKK
jgi:hypothetical protein